jgi:DNA-binding transcriptional regulator YhcF (GntR family)
MARAPVLRVDLAAPTPVYRQICDGLRPLLVSGDLAAGARLPTVRQLATDLNVHHNTVAEAYRLLAEEGWIDLRRRRGAVVMKRQAPSRPANVDKARADFSRRVRELTAQAITAGLPPRAAARALVALSDEIGAG